MKPLIKPGEREFVRSWLSDHSEWSWCLHCERAWSTEKLCESVYCPAPDCDGSPIDFWPWSKVRAARPEYPVDPVEGAAYSLYGSGGSRA